MIFPCYTSLTGPDVRIFLYQHLNYEALMPLIAPVALSQRGCPQFFRLPHQVRDIPTGIMVTRTGVRIIEFSLFVFGK